MDPRGYGISVLLEKEIVITRGNCAVQEDVIGVQDDGGARGEVQISQRVYVHYKQEVTKYGALGDARCDGCRSRKVPIQDNSLGAVRKVALKPFE